MADKGQVTEWDANGKPVGAPSAQEWDEHGNPVQAGAAPSGTGESQVPGMIGSVSRFGEEAKPYFQTFGRELGSAADAIKGLYTGTKAAFTDPLSPQEQKNFPMASAAVPQPLQTFSRLGVMGSRLVADPIANAGAWYIKAMQGKIPDPVGQILSAAPEGIGSAGGQVVAGKAIGNVLGEAKELPRDISDIRKVQELSKASGENFREGLKAVTHDQLTRVSTRAKQQLHTAREQVSQRVGGLDSDLKARDLQDNPAGTSISISDIHPILDKLANKFNAQNLPAFNKAADAFALIQKPEISFEDAVNLRTQLGDIWNKAAAGTRDEAVVGQLRDAIDQKLTDRAAKLGMTKQWDARNGLWRTMKEYENPKSPFGQLMANSGSHFFDTLRDPKNSAALDRTFNSLEDFGLKEGFRRDLINQHRAAHDFVSQGDSGMFGKWRAVMRHPMVAGTGLVLGSKGGGLLGGAMGAIKGGQLADTIEAIRAMRQSGGIPERVGEMKQFSDVQPQGLQRPAAPAAPSVDVNKLATDMQSFGYNKAEALRRAKIGVQASPNDLKGATDAAISGKQASTNPPQSVGAAAAEPATETVRRRPPAPSGPPGENMVPPEQRASSVIQKEEQANLARKMESRGATKQAIEKGGDPKSKVEQIKAAKESKQGQAEQMRAKGYPESKITDIQKAVNPTRDTPAYQKYLDMGLSMSDALQASAAEVNPEGPLPKSAAAREALAKVKAAKKK